MAYELIISLNSHIIDDLIFKVVAHDIVFKMDLAESFAPGKGAEGAWGPGLGLSSSWHHSFWSTLIVFILRLVAGYCATS